MSTTKQKQLDCMGFDRMQIASIKRNYANNKPFYTKMDRIATKVNALIEEHKQLQQEAAMSDLYTRNLAKRVTGYDLTSDAVLKFHNDAEAWEQFKAEHPIATEGGVDVAEVAEAPAEETVETPEVPAETTEEVEAPAPAQEAEATESVETPEITEVPEEGENVATEETEEVEAPTETPAETTEETAADPFGE